MHDPLVVAFEIRRPWPKRVDWERRRWYWPAVVTVWHREPGGHDAGEICKQHARVQDADGKWQWKFHQGWKLHVHHWKLQIHPYQKWRRRLLTRCTWCGGPSRKGDYVDVSHSWDGPRARWWRGEVGLYHRDCSSISAAHNSCICEHPVFEYEGYGRCARCDKLRAFGLSDEVLARRRELARIPAGKRSVSDG